MSEAVEDPLKQGSSSEMNTCTSEASRERRRVQRNITERRGRATTFQQWGLEQALADEGEQDSRLLSTLGRESDSMERQAEYADMENSSANMFAGESMVAEINHLMAVVREMKEEAGEQLELNAALKKSARTNEKETNRLRRQAEDLEQELVVEHDQREEKEDELRREIRQLKSELREAKKKRVDDAETSSEMRSEAVSLRQEVVRLTGELERSGAEPLETDKLSLQVRSRAESAIATCGPGERYQRAGHRAS